MAIYRPSIELNNFNNIPSRIPELVTRIKWFRNLGAIFCFQCSVNFVVNIILVHGSDIVPSLCTVSIIIHGMKHCFSIQAFSPGKNNRMKKT